MAHEGRPHNPCDDWMQYVAAELGKNPIVNEILLRLKQSKSGRWLGYVPAFEARVTEDADSVRVRIDMPGLDKAKTSVRIEKSLLLIDAQRKAEEGMAVPQPPRPIKKLVVLPFAFDEGQQPDAKATYVDGVLDISIKRPRPRNQIPIS
ncbi:Hsp20/alpha crystallin family protein [Nitrososphaera sp.]|uniref:Hsp20/alpha crystallin family protein n=1 Tax=Nitrososphaera sp. TaxID=1971748 RepID=UPI00307D7FE3